MKTTLRVLLVDDSLDDCARSLRALQDAFESVQSEVMLDIQGFEHALDGGNFDVVFTESKLSWTDGISVLRRVKSRFPDRPVIMLTASGSEELAVEAMKSGLDDYVVKNSSRFEQLPAVVNAALNPAPTRSRVAELEHRLQSLLKRLSVGVFRCTPQRELLEWNVAFAEMLTPQTTDDETVAAAFATLLNRSQDPHLLDPYQATAETASFDVEWKRQRAPARWLTVNIAPAMTMSGAAVFDGIVEDNTARRRAELLTDQRKSAGARLSLLSRREGEVLELVVGGKTNKVISSELGISQKTVEMHRGKMMRKLRVTSVAELVRLAISAGPVENAEF